MLTSVTSTLTSPGFLVGLGLGVAGTSLASSLLYRQVRDTARLDNEDNESGGE